MGFSLRSRRQMLPNPTPFDFANDVAGNAMNPAQLAFGARIAPDLKGYRGGKFCAADSFPNSATTRPHAVVYVLSVRRLFKVLRVNAESVVACVRRFSVRLNPSPQLQLKRQSMRQRTSAFVPDLPIAAARNCRGPHPASVERWFGVVGELVGYRKSASRPSVNCHAQIITHARRMYNGTDKAELIAGYHRGFLSDLQYARGGTV